MSTMTLEEYNAMVQDATVDLANVMKTSISSDTATITDHELTF